MIEQTEMSLKHQFSRFWRFQVLVQVKIFIFETCRHIQAHEHGIWTSFMCPRASRARENAGANELRR